MNIRSTPRMNTDQWMESEEWMESDEFLITCGNLHRKACMETLTVKDIDQAIQDWEYRGYKAYNRIITACTKDATMEYQYMDDAMTPEAVKSVVIPPFLLNDDPISAVLRECFITSCHHAASRLWIPPRPKEGVIVYSGIDLDGGEAYSKFLVVKRQIWYLYEYHDWSAHVRGKDGFDAYRARAHTLAQVLDKCGLTNQNLSRDLQMCLCKYVGSKYHVTNEDMWDFHPKKKTYRVLLSSLPDDHQAAIAYIITRTRTNYKFRGLHTPTDIYCVKSLDRALQNWVASTMHEVGIDNISPATFETITPFNDRTFGECHLGINPFVESHEHAVTLIQRRWRQICFDPNHRVGRRKVIEKYQMLE